MSSSTCLARSSAGARSSLQIGIFSSGSVLAQQLLFRHSSAGDLTGSSSGISTRRQARRPTARAIAASRPRWRFRRRQFCSSSDVIGELDAARDAGMQTVLSARPGNKPPPHGHGHPVVQSFDALALTTVRRHHLQLAPQHPMALAPGTRLGSYEILSPLGAGGMGEVYRARDTKLNRDVALKVLPPAFMADADRVARFEREARLLASLNHPHIGSIYGLEDADNVPALVLELVEGDTLDDRVRRGALPLSEALAVAQQIADALDAAHASGIIHRDLKPSNIKITRDGMVKVLDFGLAKALAARRVRAGSRRSPRP